MMVIKWKREAIYFTIIKVELGSMAQFSYRTTKSAEVIEWFGLINSSNAKNMGMCRLLCVLHSIKTYRCVLEKTVLSAPQVERQADDLAIKQEKIGLIVHLWLSLVPNLRQWKIFSCTIVNATSNRYLLEVGGVNEQRLVGWIAVWVWAYSVWKRMDEKEGCINKGNNNM